MYMYIYVYICIYIYMYMYIIGTRVLLDICINLCMCVCARVCIGQKSAHAVACERTPLQTSRQFQNGFDGSGRVDSSAPPRSS